MNQVIFSFLIILSFSIGGFLGFLAGNGSLEVKFDLAALSGVVGAVGTVFTAVIAYRALHSWREQKKTDIENEIFNALINFNKDIYLARLKYKNIRSYNANEINNAANFLNEELNVSFNNIRASIRFYLYFTRKEKNKIDVETFANVVINSLFKRLHEKHSNLCQLVKPHQMALNNPNYSVENIKNTLNKSKDDIIEELQQAHNKIDDFLKNIEYGSS